MIKGIMFDMGDTLFYNTDISFIRSIEKLYESIINKENINKDFFIKKSYEILQEIFRGRKELEFKMIDYLFYIKKLFNIEYNNSLNQIEEEFAFNSCQYILIDNVKEILKYFKNKKYPLILLSNTSFSKNIIIKILGNLVDYFDEIIVSSDYPFRKPNKYIFELGINKFQNIDKQNIFYIGNDYNADVMGAINSGINPIWFNENKTENNSKNNVKKIKNYLELIEENF